MLCIYIYVCVYIYIYIYIYIYDFTHIYDGICACAYVSVYASDEDNYHVFHGGPNEKHVSTRLPTPSFLPPPPPPGKHRKGGVLRAQACTIVGPRLETTSRVSENSGTMSRGSESSGLSGLAMSDAGSEVASDSEIDTGMSDDPGGASDSTDGLFDAREKAVALLESWSHDNCAEIGCSIAQVSCVPAFCPLFARQCALCIFVCPLSARSVPAIVPCASLCARFLPAHCPHGCGIDQNSQTRKLMLGMNFRLLSRCVARSLPCVLGLF